MDAMTGPDAAAGPYLETHDDAACSRHAERLASDNPGWLIIWVVPAREYRAYRRVPGGRLDITLAGPAPPARPCQNEPHPAAPGIQGINPRQLRP
jgi:hypothetical protein